MKKAMLGGEGKTGGDMHKGKPREIITHIHAGHAKPEIFEGENEHHPKTDSHGKGAVNIGGDCSK